jgi:regulatory protein
MKVTALKAQVKNANRVSIFVDEKYEFSLSLDELVKYKLKKDDELTAADVKKFKKISTDGKLRARALEWLINRPHSEREFRDYLYRKKAEPEQIEALLNEFIEKAYLDNRKFALWFIDLQVRRNKSDRQIRAELYKKGIDREVVSEVLRDDITGEIERLKSIINKKRGNSRYKNDPIKFAKYLTSQGFSYQLVKQQLSIEETDS